MRDCAYRDPFLRCSRNHSAMLMVFGRPTRRKKSGPQRRGRSPRSAWISMPWGRVGSVFW